MTSSWFFLSTLNYDARSTTHQIYLKTTLPGQTHADSCNSTFCNVRKIHNAVQLCDLWVTLYTTVQSKYVFVYYNANYLRCVHQGCTNNRRQVVVALGICWPPLGYLLNVNFMKFGILKRRLELRMICIPLVCTQCQRVDIFWQKTIVGQGRTGTRTRYV